MFPNINCKRLLKEDIEIPCKELALYLLGKILVRKLGDGSILKGIIVETECYLGGEDKASHSFNGRRTSANEPMYMPAGTTYVYMTYGMYYCLNISSKEPGAAVLLRAIEPLCGIDIMKSSRAQKNKRGKQIETISKLCDGPSKLCIAMNITKENCNKIDLTDLKNEDIWLEEHPEIVEDFTVVHTSRIGINNAGEWTTRPLRFYILGNKCVSKRDKLAEKELLANCDNKDYK
ncbi:uncharacterized protein [Leptinotarsa decemlineata]|uniref:uncharacterized protein n=1 Tax=Leptinotarsa decemlineata TaxID=7539 RepID=UPI003D30C88E